MMVRVIRYLIETCLIIIMVWLILLEKSTMTKKIGIRKVETEMPSDAAISQIATLSDNGKHVTLEVSVQLKKYRK